MGASTENRSEGSGNPFDVGEEQWEALGNGSGVWESAEALTGPGEIPGRGCFPSKVMSSLCLGGDASLRRQMLAWEGGQGPRDN